MRSGILLCRVVWAETYRIKKEAFFAGNMRYPAAHGIAHQLSEFCAGGRWARPWFCRESGRISISRSWVHKERVRISVGDVLVLFCAVDQPSMKLRLVGWYKTQPSIDNRRRRKSDLSRELVLLLQHDREGCPSPSGNGPRSRGATKAQDNGQRLYRAAKLFLSGGNPNYERFLESVGFFGSHCLPVTEMSTRMSSRRASVGGAKPHASCTKSTARAACERSLLRDRLPRVRI